MSKKKGGKAREDRGSKLMPFDMMDAMEVIVKAQQQLQALERNADELLARLSEHGSRPLAEAAGAITDATTRLAALQSCLHMLDPALASLDTVQPSAASMEAFWRQQQGGIALAADGMAPAQTLPALVAAMNALPGVRVTAWQGRALALDLAAATMLSMLCGPSVAAVVMLAQPGSMAPLRVALFSPGEEKESPQAWPWGQSRHLVFRRASAVAAAALQHFAAGCSAGGGSDGEQQREREREQQQDPPPSSLEMLLLWLATYSDLFSRPCSATGALLAADPQDGTLLPPLFRPYRLAWRQLRAAAADPSSRTACHWQSRHQDEGESASGRY